jgi:hypothetical protein
VLLWLRYPAPAGVLTDLASRSGPITYEVLDQLRPVRSVQYLRAALVARGISRRVTRTWRNCPAGSIRPPPATKLDLPAAGVASVVWAT